MVSWRKFYYSNRRRQRNQVGIDSNHRSKLCCFSLSRMYDARSMTQVVSFPKKQYIQLSCDISHDNQFLVCFFLGYHIDFSRLFHRQISTSNGFNGSGAEISVRLVFRLTRRDKLRSFRLVMGYPTTKTTFRILWSPGNC